jgi:hypothetical protein
MAEPDGITITSVYYGPSDMLKDEPAEPLWSEEQRLHFRWRKVRQDALKAFEGCCAGPTEVQLDLLETLIRDTYAARRAWFDAVKRAER